MSMDRFIAKLHERRHEIGLRLQHIQAEASSMGYSKNQKNEIAGLNAEVKRIMDALEKATKERTDTP